MTEVEYLQVGLSGPAASVLADFGSIAQDLAFARDAARRYAEMAEAHNLADMLMANALWNSAAVAYRRAFASGKAMLQSGKARLKLDRAAVARRPELTPEQAAAHTETLELGDRHVAHRVGDQEDARVVAYLSPPPAPREVAALAVLFVKMIGPEPDVARRVAEVADFLINSLVGEIEGHRDEFLEALRTDPNVDRLYDSAESGNPAT